MGAGRRQELGDLSDCSDTRGERRLPRPRAKPRPRNLGGGEGVAGTWHPDLPGCPRSAARDGRWRPSRTPSAGPALQLAVRAGSSAVPLKAPGPRRCAAGTRRLFAHGLREPGARN